MYLAEKRVLNTAGTKMKTHSELSDLQCRRKHRKSRGEGIIIRLSIFAFVQFSMDE